MAPTYQELVEQLRERRAAAALGGPEKSRERHVARGKLLAHEDAWEIATFENERNAPAGFAQPVRAW